MNPTLYHPRLLLNLVWLAGVVNGRAELRVPAFTAYADPDPDAIRISPWHGVSEWNDPSNKLLWFGNFNATGTLGCSLILRLPPDAESRLKLTLAGTSREVLTRGSTNNPLVVSVGKFEIPVPGYQRLSLQSLNDPGQPAGDVEALVLDGPASEGARFNLKPRRNAASVHLNYSTVGLTNIDAFYCEVTALKDPLWTFYMACGWHRGYFGLQINGPTERRIIFSVWDSGGEAADRARVRSEDKVELLAKGDGVYAGDFGNEGTGGHSHLAFPWPTGDKQRFLLTARPAGASHAIYSGYYFVPDKKQWMLISSWKAPRESGYLHGLHSFSEDFGGANGQLRRKALYGNQWARTADGRWHELTTASFSHDPTGRADRLDRFMGVENGQFFLSQGGFIPGSSKYGEKFDRPRTGKIPSDLPLPL